MDQFSNISAVLVSCPSPMIRLNSFYCLMYGNYVNLFRSRYKIRVLFIIIDLSQRIPNPLKSVLHIKENTHNPSDHLTKEL